MTGQTHQPQYQGTDSNSIAANASFSMPRLFLTWFRIGCTSFGGGAITQYLIQENFIYKRHWITEEEYANIIAMCQIAPGINIISYTILIGKRLAGWAGIIVSLLGLILPSAAITIGISAVYAGVREVSRVQTSLHTLFAAIFGISVATNWRNVKPILRNGHQRGTLVFGATLAIIGGSALIYVLFNPPVTILYLLGGLCGALAYWHAAKLEHKNQEE